MTERTLGREQAIYRVTWIGFAVNLVLSAGKLAAGIWGHSAAMVADAIHSVSDFATDLVVLLFVRVSAKPRDDDHDYGHGKYETLATLIIGVALAGVGIKLLWSGGTAIRDFTRGLLPTQPGVVALWAAVVSIVAKEALYRYTARVGRRVNSPSVVANAWHHRSAQQHLDTFGQAAEQLAGTRRTQRHGHRFGAPDRRHDLAPKQIGNGFSLRRRNHLEKKFYAPKDTDKRRQKQLFQALCRNGRSKTRLNR